ncbi:MAG: MATE family efflux transporter [Burkholderiaceae bacterium]|nr:MATE family efflux transporter [Burkholderiaceae bacterium]
MPSQRPLWRAFLAFLGPLLLTNILQSLSGTLNNVYLGQMIGVKALAAVTGFFPILFFCVAFAIGLGAGASVLIGQAWGARETNAAREVAGSTLALGTLLGLVVAVLGGMFAVPMMRALGTPPDILENATRVARIGLVAMPLVFIAIMFGSMLRGVGDTVSPLFMGIITTVLGLILTPALIRGWWGLPRMGVTSAVWGGVAAFMIALVWLVLHLQRKNSPLKLDLEFLHHLHLNPRLLKNVLRIGIPTGVQMIVVSSTELILVRLVNRYGSDATAAYGAVNQVVNYVQMPAVSIAITASILGAQAIGAGRVDRLSAITRTAMLMNLLLTGLLAVLGYLLSRQLMGFFITSAPVVETAQTLLHIMLWSLVIFGMAAALSGIMRASGTVWVPMGISAGCIALVELPTAVIASHYLGLSGVWVGYPVAFCAMLLLQVAYYQGVWRKRSIKRMI